MEICRAAAEKRGIECDQVLELVEFSKTKLKKYSVVVTNMLPKFSGNRADKYTLAGWTVIANCYKIDVPVCVYTEMVYPPSSVAAYRSGAMACFSALRITFDDALLALDKFIESGDIWIDEETTDEDRNKIICTHDDIFCDLVDSDIDVISRLLSGQSYDDIARDRDMQPGTLRNKMSKILSKKTEIKGRRALIDHAKKIGMHPTYR